MSMFEKATRKKLRFNTNVGSVTTEDLWDLPLESTNGVDLDTIAKELNKAVKDSGEESFVKKRDTTSTLLELKFDIVKHVIEVKLEEAEKAEKRVLNKAKKDKLLTILAKKEDETLEDLDPEDIKKLINELD